MLAQDNTMKLRLRTALFVCGSLSFCAICLTLSRLPTLHDRKSSFLPNSDTRQIGVYDDNGEFPHIFTFRKRLNKSNYSSDNISPEMAKRALEIKSLANDTNEDMKYQSDSVNQEVVHETHQVHKMLNSLESHENNLEFNFSSSTVDLMLNKLQTSNGLKFNFEKTRLVSYTNFLKLQTHRFRRKGMGLPIYENYNGGPQLTHWERFHKGIHKYGLYDGLDPAVDGILDDIATQQIVDVEQKEGGTQLKLIMTFQDEGQALFKPMRGPRDQETLPDHFYFVDFERHNSEIAAFHLDRILAFHRVPPTVGRHINLTGEIKRLGDTNLRKTFFLSPANNVCFHGSCSYYCDTSHAVCGRPVLLEASLAAFLPPERIAPRKTWRNPWKRSYSKHRKAYWESFSDLCERVQEKEPYHSGRRLLDVIDMHVFDFLTGNMDRHHYETFADFGNETFLLHLDNGRGFGRSDHDEISILSPLFQCCMIRHSTFIKLVKLYLGPEHLSSLMRQSMSRDPVTPVLVEKHLNALDRRVIRVLKTIAECMESVDYTDVIVDDFF